MIWSEFHLKCTINCGLKTLERKKKNKKQFHYESESKINSQQAMAKVCSICLRRYRICQDLFYPCYRKGLISVSSLPFQPESQGDPKLDLNLTLFTFTKSFALHSSLWLSSETFDLFTQKLVILKPMSPQLELTNQSTTLNCPHFRKDPVIVYPKTSNVSSVFYNSISGANIALVSLEEKRLVFLTNFKSFSETDYLLCP